jgi:predicted N-acetyltransferase YhbS
MHLRAVDMSDIPRLQEIEKLARSRYLAEPDLVFAADTPPISANRLEEGEVIVAEEDGHAIGFVLLNELDHMLYIANVSVDIGLSGRGVGAQLIRAAVDLARTRGLSALTLATFNRPRWNGPWFRRLGFSPMPKPLIGPGLNAILRRHGQYLDMTTRETLWRPVSGSKPE